MNMAKNLHKTGLRMWSAQGSLPANPTKTYRRNVTAHIIAECIDEAVNAFGEVFPGATLYSCHASETVGHLILTDGACTAIIDP